PESSPAAGAYDDQVGRGGGFQQARGRVGADGADGDGDVGVALPVVGDGFFDGLLGGFGERFFVEDLGGKRPHGQREGGDGLPGADHDEFGAAPLGFGEGEVDGVAAGGWAAHAEDDAFPDSGRGLVFFGEDHHRDGGVGSEFHTD